ncbi:aldehyde reductase [Rhizodiscina lignyota]|uniref:Aldehyde reductase n=1 Tax=Rhizodiscina lignyota TaxID=1504668 RepID=A0A9P4IDM0_9PEZI|nr:aldehyde reductase [Rhizodiscina lignyota]
MAVSGTDLAIPKGSLVVVTGANGYIGSNVVDQLLLTGYRVRGTVRNMKHAEWMQPLLDEKYGKGKFELAEVKDMAAKGAFNEVVKGASGFCHVATPVMVSFDPNEGVPIVVNGILHALEAAASEPSVKRVVMTSSSTAAASPQPNKVFTMDENTWNEDAVKAAWAPPPYEGLQRRLDVYSASKTQAEQAAWKFMKEKNPGFVLNCVLPNMNIGHILSVKDQGYPSTSGWVRALWDGFKGHEDLEYNPPQYYINVQDNARVHIAGLIYSDVKGERLYSFAHPYNWNDMLAVLRKLYPDRKFHEDYSDIGHDLSKVANERAEELVKRFGQPGWTSLEDSIKAVTDTIVS